MSRLTTALALVAVMQLGLFATHAVAATPIAPALASALPDGAVADTGVLCLRGAQPCFGYGSNNCCNEMEVLGYIGAGTGNWWAAAIAAAYQYAYC